MFAKNMLQYSVIRYHSNQNCNMIRRTFSAGLILNRKEYLSHKSLNMISKTFSAAPILNRKENLSHQNLNMISRQRCVELQVFVLTYGLV